MRKYYYLIYDLACICGALVVALYLRHGFPLIQEGDPQDIFLLLLATFVAGLVVFAAMRTHTGMWRYTSMTDLAHIMLAVALVVVACNSSLFLISRLEMMPRSVPPMHWALAVMGMGGARLLARQLLGPARGLPKHQKSLKQHVIIVGTGHTAELYLQFIKRIVQHQVVVEGLVDSNPALTNRLFHKYKILGTLEQLPLILSELLVHGIHISQIVLAQSLADLPPQEQKLLQQLKEEGRVLLMDFAKHMDPEIQPHPAKNAADFYQQVIAISADSYEKPAGYYPYLKRWIDVLMGLALVITLSPLFLLTALLVALDVGRPVIFWQQRPGLHGKPFRLYKFRTMRTAGRRFDEDRRTHKSFDSTRTSTVGSFLRRLRLDELPQLFHIISGTMSFVGPRPLLPDDQPPGGEMRLSVRPGVTGWAQIHGGDALTPAEKLILDVWYIRNMSLWLDLRIVLRTLIVVMKKDKRGTLVIDLTNKGAPAHE